MANLLIETLTTVRRVKDPKAKGRNRYEYTPANTKMSMDADEARLLIEAKAAREVTERVAPEVVEVTSEPDPVAEALEKARSLGIKGLRKTDSLEKIEAVIAAKEAESNATDTVEGGSGDDTVEGGAGDDEVDNIV